ncbi:MAG: hypothetical protein Q4G58_14350 [bacterium]|nr:hypothetical protein [bacterium]
MRLLQRISYVVLVLSLILMGFNHWVSQFNDWFIRVLGILMLICIFTLSYSTVRLRKK